MARTSSPVYGFQTPQQRDAFVKDYVPPTAEVKLYTSTFKNNYGQDKTWFFIKLKLAAEKLDS